MRSFTASKLSSSSSSKYFTHVVELEWSGVEVGRIGLGDAGEMECRARCGNTTILMIKHDRHCGRSMQYVDNAIPSSVCLVGERVLLVSRYPFIDQPRLESNA